MITAEDELIIPITGDDELYFNNNADNEMNFFTGSLINLSVNLTSPLNGTTYTTSVDIDITFEFVSTNPY
ncbi:MAG: hypothetical protein ACK40Q_04740, partial [Pseudothermotoga sp.]